MKGLAVLFGLAVVAIGGYFVFLSKMDANDQRMITIAVGNTDGKVSDLHLVIAPLMISDGPREDATSGAVYWDEWLEEHFIMTSAAGDKVKFERLAQSNLISDKQAGGAPEFYIKGKIKHGTAYTFDFVPVDEEPERFRYELTAPTEMPVTRVNFTRVSK